MANFLAIHSLGESLIEYLQRAYEREKTLRDTAPMQPKLPSCNFALLSSEVMTSETGPTRPAVSLFLYRVTMNEHLRNRVPTDGPPALALDLHYLLTVWVNQVAEEQRILGMLLQLLFHHQTLSGSDLTPEGGWQPGDVVHLIPAELSNEDLMRIWDALKRPYHLSLSYVARVVMLEGQTTSSVRPVVATRVDVGNVEETT